MSGGPARRSSGRLAPWDGSEGAAPPSTPRGSNRPLAEIYDAALLDLDGVVYRSDSAVAHAAEVVSELRRRGMAIGYVTNNASRTPEQVAAYLRELGIPATAADVVTSAQAGARLVTELVPARSAVLVVGGDGIVEALKERALQPARTLAESPAAVLQGYGPEVGWVQLAEASYAIEAGLPWIATNMDRTIPTSRGIAPGNGALVAAVATATGATPIVAGKPESPLHHESVLRLKAARPLVVGDRLDTDIEGACRVGADSLLVLTGVTSPATLVAADPMHRPTYIAADLRGLLTSQPLVEVEARGRARCRGWMVVVGETIKIDGAGDPVDGLRALCAASWSANRELSPAAVSAAIVRLGL
jgi:glycerol-1-phosphatase